MTRTLLLPMVVVSLFSSALTLGVGMLMLPPTSQAEPAQQAPPAPVVRAERFELVDASGTVRAYLGIDDGSPGLAVLDSTGQWRIIIGVGPGNEALMVARDPQGPSAVLAAVPGAAEIGLRDPGNRIRTRLALTADDLAAVEVGDHLAQVQSARAVLGMRPEGVLVMGITDSIGRPRIELFTDLTTNNGEPTMRVLGDTGRPIWQAP